MPCGQKTDPHKEINRLAKLTTLATLLKPGGSRAVIAENLLLKQQQLNKRNQTTTQPDALDEPAARHLPQSLAEHHWRRVRQVRRV
jgi:hypothetical protein